MTLSDICKKDVIQVELGINLGRADDLRFNGESAQIEGLVLMGRPRFFGLWGKQEDMFVPWQDIEIIGSDVILVHTQLLHTEEFRQKPGFFARMFS